MNLTTILLILMIPAHVLYVTLTVDDLMRERRKRIKELEHRRNWEAALSSFEPPVHHPDLNKREQIVWQKFVDTVDPKSRPAQKQHSKKSKKC